MSRLYSRNRLARLYKVNRHTITAWLSKNPRLQHLAGLRRHLFPSEVELIKAELGDWEE